ncbi:hypothetical protein K438DRAFT_1778735 [Mycena galopus ATCC 62051]|nr:hypothetical protein K438DRAFT_1778725 [Mycena galopus ATCC 62051]KAF8151219.1 hypothetical protein K438DRAFT_1778735 [Mycena galopus ATCC 62051]
MAAMQSSLTAPYLDKAGFKFQVAAMIDTAEGKPSHWNPEHGVEWAACFQMMKHGGPSHWNPNTVLVKIGVSLSPTTHEVRTQMMKFNYPVAHQTMAWRRQRTLGVILRAVVRGFWRDGEMYQDEGEASYVTLEILSTLGSTTGIDPRSLAHMSVCPKSRLWVDLLYENRLWRPQKKGNRDVPAERYLILLPQLQQLYDPVPELSHQLWHDEFKID